MEKEKILKDSVRKLLELNITDKEIVDNLKSVGVNEETAKRMLSEVKTESTQKPSAPESNESEEDIYSKVYDDLEKEDLKTPVIQKQIKNPSYSSSYSAPSFTPDKNLSELWEAGILATVDAKLTEMERLKKNIDAVLDEKIKQRVQVASKKMETVKSQVISDTNKSLIQNQSKFEEFMAESKKKRDEMEARLNRALQLESKVTEGLLEDAKHRIEQMQLDKEKELAKQVQRKLDELDEMTRKVDPQGIMERLSAMKGLEQELVSRQKQIDAQIESQFRDVSKEFEKYKKDVSKIDAGNLAELEKEYRANVDGLFSSALELFDKKFKKKLSEIEAKEKQLDLEKFNATMESLDLFKKQFVNTVTTSVEDYNKSKKELAQAIIERDKTINDYLKRIDEKIKELNDFEQKFAKEVSELIDEVPEEKLKKASLKKSKS